MARAQHTSRPGRPHGRRPHPGLARALMLLALIGVPLWAAPDARAQSAAELQGYQQRLQRLFQRLDQNGDQRLERREVEGHPYLQRHFERLDPQQRGHLRPEDLRPAAAPPGSGGGERARRFLERADSDGDGRLERREAEAYPWLQRRFQEADRNGDGALNRDELSRLRQRDPRERP